MRGIQQHPPLLSPSAAITPLVHLPPILQPQQLDHPTLPLLLPPWSICPLYYHLSSWTRLVGANLQIPWLFQVSMEQLWNLERRDGG